MANFELPGADFIKIARKYLPNGVQVKNFGVSKSRFLSESGEDQVQQIMNNTENGFRLFTTAAEFYENLKVFRTFTGAHRFFPLQEREMCILPPVIHETTNGKLVIRKSDFYALVQQSVFDKFAVNDDRVFQFMVSYFLKNEEAETYQTYGYIWYPEDLHDATLSKEMDEIQHKVYEDSKKGKIPSAPRNMHSALLSLVDIDIDEEIVTSLKGHLDQIQPETRDKAAKRIYTLEKLFSFLSPWLKKQLKNFTNPTQVINLFTDNGDELVIAENVRNPMDHTTERFFNTISFDEALRIPQFLPIEYVEIPIVRTKHRAVPVIGPEGQFIKLAADVFFELLFDLFFGIKLFQRIEKSEWGDVEVFFEELRSVFDTERKAPYFLPPPDNPLSDYFLDLLNRPAKEVRIIGNLTKQVLKEMLVDLGLVENFPEILDFVKDLPESCDVFEALTYCQTRSLCKRIPWLVEFIYNQRAQHRVPHLPKPQECSRTRFRNTCWKDMDLCEANTQYYKNHVVDITISSENLMISGKLTLSFDALETMIAETWSRNYENWTQKQQEEYSLEVERFRKSLEPKMFVFDVHELNRYIVSKMPTDTDDVLNMMREFSSLEEFVKENDKTAFYLRYFYTNAFRRAQDRRVFTEEALEIVSVLLLKNDDKTKHSEINEKYRGSSETMDLKELKQLLDEADVNKELITLVPDVHYANAALVTMPIFPANPNIRLKDTFGKMFMDISLAYWEIFQWIVCDLKWDREVMDNPEFSQRLLKACVLHEMSSLPRVQEDFYEHLYHCIHFSAGLDYYEKSKNQKILTPLTKLHSADFNDYVNLSIFLSECKAHDIECTQPRGLTRKNLEAMEIPVWKARILFLYAWIEKFFTDSENADLKRKVMKGFMHRIPITTWDPEAKCLDLLFFNRRKDKMNAAVQETVRKLALRSVPALRNTTVHSLHPWFRDEAAQKKRFPRCESQQYFDNVADVDEHNTLVAMQQREINARDEANDLKALEVLETIAGKQVIAMRESIKELFREITEDESPKMIKLREQLRYTAKPSELLRTLREVPIKSVSQVEEEEIVYVDREDYAEDAARIGVTEEELLESLDKEFPMGIKHVIRKPSKNALKKKRRKEKMWERSHNAMASHEVALEIPADPDSKGSNDQQPSEKSEQERLENSTSRSSSQDSVVPELLIDSPSQAIPEEEPQPNVQVPEETLFQPRDPQRESACCQRQPKKQVSDEALDQSRNPQKESACCPKCVRTIERCENAKVELKRESNKNEKLSNENRKLKKEKESLEEQLKVFLDKEEEMPREKLIEKVEDLTKQKEDLKERELEMQKRIAELERSLEASKNTIDQLNVENSQLEVYNSDSHKSIKALRSEMHRFILPNIPYHLPLELSRVLADVRDKLDTLRGQDLVGKAASKVEKLIILTENDEIKERAAHELRKVQLDFREYEEALEKSIELIQKTPFITKPELPKIPDLPDLPKEFYDVWKQAIKAKNDELDRECVVCKDTEEVETLFRCPHCPKLIHKSCLGMWWNGKDEGTCPHCLVFISKNFFKK